MKVLIIEDEAPAFRRLQKVLEEVKPGVEIVEVLDSVQESIKWFNNHQAPDLIFMDIQLSDGISFEIFEQVSIKSPLIFTTAFDDYMLRAFKVNSIDYLLKPIKKEEVEASLRKLEDLRAKLSGPAPAVDLNELIQKIKLDDKRYRTRFLIKQGDKMLSVEAAAVAYFQLRHGVVHLVTQQGKDYLLDFSLDELVQQLDPQQFYRANRQFIIHFQAIESVHKYLKGKLLVKLHVSTPEPITISSERTSDFKEWFGQ